MSVSTSRGAFANESVARIVRPQDVRTGPASWATTWVWYAGAVWARRSRTASVAPRNISMGPATSRTWASSKTTMAIFFMAWTGFGRIRGLIVHPEGPGTGQYPTMTLPIIATLGFATLVTSFISGILGMAGGMILMGVLLASLTVPAAMLLHGITQFSANGWR